MILHFHTPDTWLNDPNGLVWYNGQYHMFFQWNPHDNVWGDMHWGHAVSQDLYHWTMLPAAMKPWHEKDEDHCFSGSCCLDQKGKPHFFYTSIGSAQKGRDAAHGARQWMAEPTDDTLNTLLQTDEHELLQSIHGDVIVDEWRDPCVIHYQDRYLMVCGGLCEGKGVILLYQSVNMKDWSFVRILLQAEQADSVTWECPNILTIGDKIILFWSPCSVVRYAIGTLDEELTFHTEHQDILDAAGYCGYYAPQCLKDQQGRAVLMGWMRECDDGADVKRRTYNGCMALPRILRIEDGILKAEAAEGWQVVCPSQHPANFPAGVTVSEEPGQCFVLTGEINVEDDVTICLKDAAGMYTEIRYTGHQETPELVIDRSHGAHNDRTLPDLLPRTIQTKEKNASLFLCFDEHTLECAVDGQWCSSHAYAEGGFTQISVVSKLGFTGCWHRPEHKNA